MTSGVGLATAFHRLFILHALEHRPARPAAILAALHAREGALSVESGTFSRALQQLLEAGHLSPAEAGAVALTPLGRREREEERAVWERVVRIVGRLLAGHVPAPEPPDGGGLPLAARRTEPVAERHRERVVLAEIREASRRARDGGDAFAVVLAEVAVAHSVPHRSTAMLQRALRETLGRARSTFAPGIAAHRYGAQGVCLVLPAGLAVAQGEILRARLLESLGAMSATVADFAGARYAVRLGSARWSAAAPTSGAVLAAAEAALEEAAARAA